MRRQREGMNERWSRSWESGALAGVREAREGEVEGSDRVKAVVYQ